ncbi:MAG: hypothetical protein MKZ95_17635 [Pirellulales bacterium]|nr:hypothetical protein [Pirellulales bacterium]
MLSAGDFFAAAVFLAPLFFSFLAMVFFAVDFVTVDFGTVLFIFAGEVAFGPVVVLLESLEFAVLGVVAVTMYGPFIQQF